MQNNDILKMIQQYESEGKDIGALSAAVQSAMTAGKTPLGLNQWELSDKPLMSEFNSDNQIIDEKLRELSANKANMGLPTYYELEFKNNLVSDDQRSVFWKNSFGEVTLYISAQTEDNTNSLEGKFLIATLPQGFRPMSYQVRPFFVRTTGSESCIATLNIETNGNISVHLYSSIKVSILHGAATFLSAS